LQTDQASKTTGSAPAIGELYGEAQQLPQKSLARKGTESGDATAEMPPGRLAHKLLPPNSITSGLRCSINATYATTQTLTFLLDTVRDNVLRLRS
jgi:hypothetical protein